MKNSDYTIEQYRGDKPARSFSPTGDKALEYERERQELSKDEWMGLVEDTADSGRGLSVHNESRPGQGADFEKWF